VNRRLVLLEGGISVQSMIHEIPGVNLVRNLEFSLIEYLFKYAPRDRLVHLLLRDCKWQ
jgi:hypothetical protein